MFLRGANNQKELAVGYIRVSGERQVVEGNSLATQEVTVRRYAQDRGYILLKLFSEPGQSAKTDNRPALKELLIYCKERKGRIKVVVFPKLDRFARYSRDYLNLKHNLSDLGIRLESVSENFTDTPFGRFSESIMAAQAQLDNEVRAERAKDGHIQALKEGRWPWPAPGFEKTKVGNRNTVKPKEPEASLVREAFERIGMRRERPNEVREWLWEQGIRLSRAGFYRTLKKKLYIGILESYGVSQAASLPIVPLISEELFARVQTAISPSRTNRTYDRDNPDFPLRGTLKCTCGNYLTACWSQGKTQRYAYYRCMSCKQVNIPRVEAEKAFCGLLNQLQPRESHINKLRTKLESRWELLSARLQDKATSIDHQIAQIKKLQQAIVLKSAQGVIPDDLAKEQLAELGQKIIDSQAEKPQSVPAASQVKDMTNFFLSFISRPGDAWRRATPSTQKRLQRFYWPSGLTYLGEGYFRTRKNDPFTGLKSALLPYLSQEAGRPNDTSNLVSKNQQATTDVRVVRLGEICFNIYEEFGSNNS